MAVIPTLLVDLVTGKDREKAARAFRVMLQMDKIDLEKIKHSAAE